MSLLNLIWWVHSDLQKLPTELGRNWKLYQTKIKNIPVRAFLTDKS